MRRFKQMISVIAAVSMMMSSMPINVGAEEIIIEEEIPEGTASAEDGVSIDVSENMDDSIDDSSEDEIIIGDSNDAVSDDEISVEVYDEEELVIDTAEDVLPAMYAAYSAEPIEECIVETAEEYLFLDDYLAEQDELLEGYLSEDIFSGISLFRWGPARNQLNHDEQLIFDQLKEGIQAVAEGESADTAFKATLANADITTKSWTAEELGVERTIYLGDDNKYHVDQAACSKAWQLSNISMTNIFSALLADCPYELYWFNKTAAPPVKISYVYSFGTVKIDNEYPERGAFAFGPKTTITFSFAVANEFGASEPYKIDLQKTTSVGKAKKNVENIIASSAGKDSLKILSDYKDIICDMVSYNSAATQPGVNYGNPWQLIYVFDEDPDTNVVCEGYAKAFKYLCDLTGQLSADGIWVNIAWGQSRGSGSKWSNHMWNIVQTPDGNYLVDVTNCDDGMIGYPNKLFMNPPAYGTCSTAYSIDVGYGGYLTYRYDEDVPVIFEESDIKLVHADNYAEHKAGEVREENPIDTACVKKHDKVVYCTLCEAELSREEVVDESVTHTPGPAEEENRVEPSCTAAGSYDEVKYCTECEEELSRIGKTIEKAEHTPGSVVAENRVEPSCTVAGSYDEVTYCTKCNEKLSSTTKPIAKKAHTLSAWKTTTAATVFSPAKQERHCTVSGCTYSETRNTGASLPKTATLTASSVTIKKGTTVKNFKVSGMAKGDYVASWTSTNTKCFTVSGSQNGTCSIKGIKAGSAVLVIKLKSGLEKRVNIKIQKGAVATTSLTGIPGSRTLKVGDKLVLKPVIKPFNTQSKLKFSSSKKSCATVTSSGIVTAKKAGKAVITVTSGKKKVKCRLTILAK